MSAGSAIFINSAIWHSGARNESEGLRRGIYLYYGYWWLKRYDAKEKLPWQAFEGAPEFNWTLEIIGTYIFREFGHTYSILGVSKLMH